MKNFIGIFGGIGLLLLAIAAFVYFREASFLRRAEVVTGTVVDLDLNSDTDGGSSYCPVIEFTTQAGEAVRYYGNVCSSPPSYDIGEKVEVVYDPQDAKHVQMNSFWSKYTGVFVLSCIGLPFFLLGVWGAFAGREKSKA